VIVPFGDVDVLEDIKDAVARTFQQDVFFAHLQQEVNSERRGAQYLAHDFLPVIVSATRAEGGDGGLGVTSVDLFVPELNFVFGLANYASRVCVISLARLDHPDRDVFVLRSIKEAVHELGHALLGLKHCPDKRCVMAFSNSLADTDYKDPTFCPRCVKYLSH